MIVLCAIIAFVVLVAILWLKPDSESHTTLHLKSPQGTSASARPCPPPLPKAEPKESTTAESAAVNEPAPGGGKQCVICGAAIPPQAKFCSECGGSQSPGEDAEEAPPSPVPDENNEHPPAPATASTGQLRSFNSEYKVPRAINGGESPSALEPQSQSHAPATAVGQPTEATAVMALPSIYGLGTGGTQKQPPKSAPRRLAKLVLLIGVIVSVVVIGSLGVEQYLQKQEIDSKANQCYQEGVALQAAGKLSDAKDAFNRVVQQYPTSMSITAAKEKLKEVNDKIEAVREKGRGTTEIWANSRLSGIASDDYTTVTYPSLPGIVHRTHSHNTSTVQVLDDCTITLTSNSYNHRQYTEKPDSDDTTTRVCRVNLFGLPDSAISVKKFDLNDNSENADISTTVDWIVDISDPQRIQCTAEYGPHDVMIDFSEQRAADKTVTSLRQFVHQHCSR